MKMRFHLEGGSEMAEALAALRPRVSKSVQREVLREAAEPMRAQMALNVPRGEPSAPNLHEEMVISNARGVDGDEVAVAVGPTKRGFYGFEFGTIHQPARPFARPAFDQVAPTSLRILAEVIWREIAAKGGFRRSSQPSTPSGGGRLL